MIITTFNLKYRMQKLNNAIAKKTVNKRTDLSAAVNDKTLTKLREIAYEDAVNNNYESKKSLMYKISCREKIAPDRSKLFAQAKQKADQASAEIKRTNRTGTIWDYFLVMNGDLDNNGSYYAKVNPSGKQYIEIYDENGEQVGAYGSYSGFKVKNTEKENACIQILGEVYCKAYNEYRKEIENSQKYKSIDQKFETKA